MSVTFVLLPAGTMTRASVLANFVLLRSWMNGGIVVGDVTSPCIRSQHIFRPDSFNFPLLAQHRSSAAATAGRSKTRDSLLIWEAISRLDLYPSAVDNDGAVRLVPDLGITFNHWGPASYIVFNATWTAIATPVFTVNYVIFYQGYFQIRYRERSTGTVTTITNSRRQVQSQNTPETDGIQYSTQGRFTVTEGTWDVWVEWVPDDALTAEVCVGLTSCSMRTYRVA